MMASTNILIVMGVSGSGKSTVAALLAGRLGWALIEGDDLHPPANIEKMAHGIPLDDADRLPWLAAIGERIDQWREEGARGVITCSALKRAYRDMLGVGKPEVKFVYLQGSKALIANRLARRLGHFMPPELLDSQFAALEEPTAEEPAITIPIGEPPKQLVQDIIDRLTGEI
jgi:gluconokinase